MTDIRIHSEGKKITISPSDKYRLGDIEVGGNIGIDLENRSVGTDSNWRIGDAGEIRVKTTHNAKESTFSIFPYILPNNRSRIARCLSAAGGIAAGSYAAQLYLSTQTAPELYKAGAIAIAVGLMAGIGTRYLLKRIGKYVEDKTKITLNHDDVINTLRKLLSR